MVDYLFTNRVGDALVGERHDAEHDELDAENRCCFNGHALSHAGITARFFPAVPVPVH